MIEIKKQDTNETFAGHLERIVGMKEPLTYTHIPRLMRKIIAASLPLAALAVPFGTQGCACPREELEAAFATQASPKTLDECLELCRAQLQEHYKRTNHQDGDWQLSNVRNCEETQILTPGPPGQAGQLSKALRCEYTVIQSCVGGRLPSGLKAQEQFEASSALGAYFSKLCFLEKAAVEAFAHLARELEAHEAPEPLIQRAHQAVQEEREHADMTALLAQMYDAEVPEVTLTPQPVRRLEALAYENAVEGCVHETFAPLTALWQSQASSSPEVRAVMGRIAEEEAGHALLSWEIDAWLTPQLTPDQRRVKAAHQQGAIHALSLELHHEPSPIMREIAGMPSANEAQQLFAHMKQELWLPA